MTVMMPRNVREYDSTTSLFGKAVIRIYKASTPDTRIVAFKSNVALLEDYNTEAEKDRLISVALSEIRKENTKDNNRFFSLSDTIIDKIQCKKVEILSTNDSSVVPINVYIAIIDRKLYGVAYLSLTDQSSNDIESLLKGIKFTDSAREKEDRLRYKGVKKRDILMVLGLTALIVLIVVFVAMSRKKPKKKRRAF